MSERVKQPGGKHGRLCQVCDRDKMMKPRNASGVYPSYPWGDSELCDTADMICPFCKAAFYNHGKRLSNGDTAYWVRIVSASERAYQLYQSYNRKSRDECRERITAGDVSAADPGGVR